jgi:hypothetical protein
MSKEAKDGKRHQFTADRLTDDQREALNPFFDAFDEQPELACYDHSHTLAECPQAASKITLEDLRRLFQVFYLGLPYEIGSVPGSDQRPYDWDPVTQKRLNPPRPRKQVS